MNYENLLKRLQGKEVSEAKKKAAPRIELPSPDIIWVGHRTIFRNFGDFAKVLRRDPEKILLYLAKEIGSAASIAGEKAIFVGKREPSAFISLFDRYMKDYVICPVCSSPDTRIEKVRRLSFLVCEACGARSSMKGVFA